MSVLGILCCARCVSKSHCKCGCRKFLSARNSMMSICVSLLSVVWYVFSNFHVIEYGMRMGRYRWSWVLGSVMP